MAKYHFSNSKLATSKTRSFNSWLNQVVTVLSLFESFPTAYPSSRWATADLNNSHSTSVSYVDSWSSRNKDGTMFAKVFLTFLHGKQGRNEGQQEGHNSPGAESFRGAPKIIRSAEKSQQYHKSFLHLHYICFWKNQVRTLGRQTCFLPRAPSSLVTPLTAKSPILLDRISGPCTFE